MDKPTTTPIRSLNLLGLELNWRITLIIIVTTLLLMVDHYHRFLPSEDYVEILHAKAVERVVYYLIIPLLIIVLLFREKPSAYGFTLGRWKEGLGWTLGIIVLSVPLLYLVSQMPEMTEYYSSIKRPVRDVIQTAGIDLIGWEFVFRGFLLFGLMRVAGPHAVLLQAVPFAMAHLGKPEIETLSTIFGGTLFGVVAWRSRSFFYPFLIHWFISSFVTLIAMGYIGMNP